MNIHVGGSTQPSEPGRRLAFDADCVLGYPEYKTILEVRINDLARLARAMHVIGETVFSELRAYAHGIPQVADALALVDADVEVLEAMIGQADIQARTLRITLYEGPSEAL